jgi:hypothetical protein
MLVIIVSDRKKFRRKMSELRKAESILFGKNRKGKKKRREKHPVPPVPLRFGSLEVSAA